jgi:hypothetical protein
MPYDGDGPYDGYDSIDDLLADNGIDPGDVSGVTINWDESDNSWSIDFSGTEDMADYELGDSVPDWVWDEFYDYADEMGWDWEVEYGEN